MTWFSQNRPFPRWRHFTTTTCDPNPSGFCFLVQFRGFIIETSLGLPNLNVKEKKQKNSGRSSKMTSSCNWPIISWFETLAGTWRCHLSIAPTLRSYHNIFSFTVKKRLNTSWTKESKLARKQIQVKPRKLWWMYKCYFQETELETSVKTFS